MLYGMPIVSRMLYPQGYAELRGSLYWCEYYSFQVDGGNWLCILGCKGLSGTFACLEVDIPSAVR